MPKTKKEEYAVGYKVFFRSAVMAAGLGPHLRSAFSAGSCRCWHPGCFGASEKTGCQETEIGGLWQSYDYGPGHFTAALEPDKAPLTVFETKKDALAFMTKWKSQCFELWAVSYIPGTAPELREDEVLSVDLPKGTKWARSIRPDELVVTLRELQERAAAEAAAARKEAEESDE